MTGSGEPVWLDWARRRLGVPLRATERSWAHGSAAVWELVGGGQRFFLKLPGHRRKFRQEHLALDCWACRLPGTPRLLGVQEAEPPALLLSAVPGLLVQEQVYEEATRQSILHQAGRWLAQLHALPNPVIDPVPLGRAMDRRAHRWLGRVADLIPGATQERIRAHLPTLRDLDAHDRVPCHRDYTPRNWLLHGNDPATGFGVIDFEHSRPDWWLADCDRLIALHGDIDAPALADFWAGYGRRPDAEEQAIADVLALVQAASTIAWAHDHGDEAFERSGRERLATLLGEAAS